MFYLQASQEECGFNPDRRHDLASVGHAMMTAAGWKELTTNDPAFARSDNGSWDNRAIWTGCVVQNPADELHYMFYTARRNEDPPIWTPTEWQRKQNIGLAVSRDLVTWERTPDSLKHSVIPNPGKMIGLDGVAWRDPYVIRGEDGAWYAFICARVNPHDRNHSFETDAGGVVAWLKSDSLTEWRCEEARPLTESSEFYQLEVPQVFWRRFRNGKRLYLLFCAQQRDCSRERRGRMAPEECQTGTYYLHSDLLPFDHQEMPELRGSARLLAPDWYAGRLLDPETNPLFFGFQWADAAGHFVGGLSDPMPVEFHEDGSITLI